MAIQDQAAERQSVPKTSQAGFKVLVVDDDPDILELLCFNLQKAGYRCFSADSGEEGLRQWRQRDPDLLVLDIRLPGMSGLDVLKSIRFGAGNATLPVILLTAKGEESDRLLGFELGADDYVVKPFSVKELLLRIRTILARTAQAASSEEVVQWAQIKLYPNQHQVTLEDRNIELTATEFNLLAYLMRNDGRVLTRENLLESVWGYRYGGASRTVDTYIQRLRQKLGKHGENIHTVRGVGYKIASEP